MVIKRKQLVMKRKIFFLVPLVLLVGVLTISRPAHAVAMNSGDHVQVDFQGENETRVITGRNVELTGELNGDVYVFAGSIISKAVIHGDLIFFSGEALITGDVFGNIRGASGNLTLNNKTRNVTVATGNFTLGDQAQIQDVFIAAGESSIQGSLRNLIVATGKIFLNAQTQEDASLTGDTITFGSSANIAGDLLIKSKNKPQGFDSVAVAGNREFREVKAHRPVANAFDVILKIFSLLALVYVLWSLPGIKNLVLSFQPNAKNILLPILWAILIPIAMIILLVTMIGVPLMFLLGLLAVIGAIVAKSFAVIFLSSLISTKRMYNIHLILIFASVLAVLLGFIPYLGWIITLALCLLGWAIAIHLFKTAVK